MTLLDHPDLVGDLAAGLSPPDPSTPSASPPTAQPAPSPRRLRRAAASVGPALVTLAALVGLWYFASYRLPVERQFLLPPPHKVIAEGVLDGQAFSEIMASMWLTTKLALFGLGVAIALGMLVGIAMYRSKRLERAAFPYLVALQAVPILAISPLMTIAFGYGFLAKSIVCVIIAFFPIPTNLLLGMKSVDRGLVDLFKMNGASWWTRLRKLALPNAMPNLFTGFRISAGLAVIGAIVGETFFQQGEPGLGSRLIEYRQRLRYEELYSCLLWSSLLGIAVFVFFGWLGNRVVRSWHASAA